MEPLLSLFFSVFRPDPRIFIGLSILLLLPGFLVVATWTGIKVLVFCARRRHGRAEAHNRTHFSDGRLRPPRGQGICEDCHRAFDDLYYLPSGEKLCDRCYGVLDASP